MFFFFKQKTAYEILISDWSSDVCSSDLSGKRRPPRARHNRFVALLPIRWRFYKSGLYISPIAPLLLGFVTGMMTVILGVGGGFIIVPAMIYLLGMDIGRASCRERECQYL